ncbi:MAG: phosphatidylserine decarboxylase family protein [Acidobacteriota bacterium]|nr:MAG: phosphatidylserine decarboxylase family protein [Acidobacteriota bacterium]
MRIAREGFRYIGLLSVLGVAALAFPVTRLLAVPMFVLAGFVTYFFRDPARVPPDNEKLLVSPGDGKVVYTGPGERDPSRIQVSIFLSIFNVHINRSPLAAVVRKIRYTPGQFLAAYKPESGTKNEQNELELVDGPFSVTVRQIAGVAARRIVCRVHENDKLERGERFGLIQFGSRMEVLLPSDTKSHVKVGDRVKGGETVIAERL